MNVLGNAVAPKMDGRLQAHLGRNLKTVYRPMVEEVLPDRLRHLLGALDLRETTLCPRLITPVSHLLGHAVDVTVGVRPSQAGERASPDSQPRRRSAG
jgi:hypothetical protein